MTERVVVGHQLPQVEKIMARDIFVAHGNQQMTLRTERLAIHALAELVVDLELAVSDDKVADLRHAGPLGQMVPLVAAAVEDCCEDILTTAGQTGLGITHRRLQLLVEGEGHLDEGVVAVVADVKHITAWQPDGEAHHREHNRIRSGMLRLEIGLGGCHWIIAFSKDVQLETAVGEVGVLLPANGHRHVAIDVGRIEQVGLDLDLHFRDFRDVVTLASEARGFVLIIVGRIVYSVFIVGIRIIRGCVVIQKILEELFKIVITWLVVELQ